MDYMDLNVCCTQAAVTLNHSLTHSFTEICSYGSNWQYPGISSDNALAPIRLQAIIWTNAHPILWRIYAAPARTHIIDPKKYAPESMFSLKMGVLAATISRGWIYKILLESILCACLLSCAIQTSYKLMITHRVTIIKQSVSFMRIHYQKKCFYAAFRHYSWWRYGITCLYWGRGDDRWISFT